jgi:membrane protein
MFEKIKRYFLHDLWDFSLRGEKGWRRFYFKILRIGTLSVRGFIQDKCALRASGLTYYTMMSVVPVLAMAFAIARGFGLQEYLKTQILESFQEQQAVLLDLFSFSEKLLDQTSGSIVAGVGIAILIWTVTQLLSNMESALNHIWGVKKLRSWRRLFSDYLAIMLLAPLFFILSSSATVWIANYLETSILAIAHGSILGAVVLFFIRLIPYVLFWILFSFIYLFLPNTKVRLSSALIGGVVAGTLYLLLQWGYFYFQVGVARYGAIYGSLAALPLFLIWAQLNWFLLLFGAEISFAHQTHEQREYEPAVEQMSDRFRLLLALWITQIAVERFIERQSQTTIELLMRSYQIPYGIAVLLLQELADAGILIEVKDAGYIPNRDVNELKIADVIHALEEKGHSDLPLIPSKAVEHLERALQSFRDLVDQSEQNSNLKDLSLP